MHLLNQEDITIYQYNHTDIIHKAKDRDCLSGDELKRAESFVYEDDSQWFIACRVILRETLAKILGVSASNVCFQYNDDGKPFLDKVNKSLLQFNLSHTKDKLLIATHPYKMIGVDIEKVQDKNNEAIVQRFFHEDEIKTFEALSAAQKTDAFYRLWVIKEAIAKAKGISLYQVLNNVAIENFTTGENIIVHGMPNMDVALLAQETGYHAAIAVL